MKTAGQYFYELANGAPGRVIQCYGYETLSAADREVYEDRARAFCEALVGLALPELTAAIKKVGDVAAEEHPGAFSDLCVALARVVMTHHKNKHRARSHR